MDGASPFRMAVRFGEFAVDLRAGELRKQGVRVKLRRQPFQILAMLLERPGQGVTRKNYVSGSGLPKLSWTSHSLNKAVKELGRHWRLRRYARLHRDPRQTRV